MSNELSFTDTVIGTGVEICKGALVLCNYEGFLDDGRKFDSSYDKGQPFRFVFGVGRVIKGWDQGLIGMKEGGKRSLYVPSHLAYGDRKVSALIAPHSNLHFNIELLEVRPRE
jgi:FKBP-type peptidyl-prolyl cis-trans isomerase